MLKMDRTLQKNPLTGLWHILTRRAHNNWFWAWGSYGIPWAEPGKYWLWGLGWFTLCVYDGRLWSIQANID